MANAARNVVQEPVQSLSIWDRIAESNEFKDLMATKKTFIVPAFIFFLMPGALLIAAGVLFYLYSLVSVAEPVENPATNQTG